MSSPLLTVDGMVHRRCSITIEQLIDHAVVDGHGRILVPMIDVLAMGHLDSEAELVSLRSPNGASHVLRVSEVIERGDVFLRLRAGEVARGADAAWSVGLWSPEAGPSATIVSISAMTFASFVGLE